MIPDQDAAVANAKKLLKVNGMLAVADFFLKGNYHDCLPPFVRRLVVLESVLLKNWFAMDHVHLLTDDQVDKLGSNGLETIWDNRFRGPVPFLPFLNPFHGVYIAKKVKA